MLCRIQAERTLKTEVDCALRCGLCMLRVKTIRVIIVINLKVKPHILPYLYPVVTWDFLLKMSDERNHNISIVKLLQDVVIYTSVQILIIGGGVDYT